MCEYTCGLFKPVQQILLFNHNLPLKPKYNGFTAYSTPVDSPKLAVLISKLVLSTPQTIPAMQKTG